MKQYQITTNKANEIKNDPNLWGQEYGNSRYIPNMLLRVVNMNVQTMDIVKKLPKEITM